MKVLAILIVVAALVIAIAPQYTNCEAKGGTMPGATSTGGAPMPSASNMGAPQAMATPAAMGGTAAKVVAKMKCYWTAHAEIAVGVPLAAAGLLLLFARRRESKRALGVITALLGLSAVLLPTALIGTCVSSGAVCNTTMKPLLLVAGGITIALGVIVLVLAQMSSAAGGGADQAA